MKAPARKTLRRTAANKTRPRPKSVHGRRRNPGEREQAEALYAKFHGEPSKRTKPLELVYRYPSHIWKCGRLAALKVRGAAGKYELKFRGVDVYCSPDGGQLYLTGGDQRVDLGDLGLARFQPKDQVVLGEITHIAYVTTKDFHNFEPTEYTHRFGEDGGTRPTLGYDVLSQLLWIAGGTYQVRREGIVN